MKYKASSSVLKPKILLLELNKSLFAVLYNKSSSRISLLFVAVIILLLLFKGMASPVVESTLGLDLGTSVAMTSNCLATIVAISKIEVSSVAVSAVSVSTVSPISDRVNRVDARS